MRQPPWWATPDLSFWIGLAFAMPAAMLFWAVVIAGIRWLW